MAALAAGAPGLTLATFLGGLGSDAATALRTDPAGNVYIAGTTSSENFPVIRDAIQKTGPGTGCITGPKGFNGPCVSIFVAKFSRDGALLYSTYIGRNARQRLIGMDIDDAGAFYLAVMPQDRMPELPGVLKPANGYTTSDYGGVIVLKLSPGAPSLDYATLVPTSGRAGVRGLAVDASGALYLTGYAATGVPAVNAPQPEPRRAQYFFTQDRGQTWKPGSIPADTGAGMTVAADPRNAQVVYMGFENGLYKTVDAGAHWTALVTAPLPGTDPPGNALNPVSLAIDPVRSNVLYLLVRNAPTLFKSVDAGVTWTPANNTRTYFRRVVLNPANPDVLYASGTGGVYKSTDAGATWSPTSLSGDGTNVGEYNALVIDVNAPNTLYAGTEQGVMKTTDGGATWRLLANGFPNDRRVTALGLNPADTRSVYASLATDHAPYRSLDAGETWAQTVWPSTTYASAPINYLADPLVPATLYAGTTAGLFLSRDAGQTWTDSGLPAGVIQGTAAAPNGTVYALAASEAASDAFVLKLDASGSKVVYSTYVGGSGNDSAAAIAVDRSGRAWLVGESDSFDFPGAGGFRARPAGNRDAFVAALDASGRPLWSTFIGGALEEHGNAIALDAAGDIHIAGDTVSADFPVVKPVQKLENNTEMGFAAKLKGDGSDLLFSTYIGGSKVDYPASVAADAAGNTYVSGWTDSPDLPATFPFSLGPFMSGFAVAFDDAVGRIQWLAYLGISAEGGIALDPSGNAWIAGQAGLDFPARRYAAQEAFGGDYSDAFLVRISPMTTPPQPVVAAVTDAAAYTRAVAPGEIVALFGANLLPVPAQATAYPLPAQLGGVAVTVNDRAAPLYYASPFQLNIQIPYETAPGAATIHLTSAAGASTIQVQVVASAPSIFTQDASGTGPGAIQHGIGLQLVTDENPAAGGETVAIYCTGLGAVSPASASGAAATVPLSWATMNVSATIGGQPSEVSYAGLTPGLAGVYQVNAKVPAGLAPGRQPVQLSAGSATSNTVEMAVQ